MRGLSIISALHESVTLLTLGEGGFPRKTCVFVFWETTMASMHHAMHCAVGFHKNG